MNFTANADRALDNFHADMVNAAMEDMIDDMHAADSDYSPVPTEYVGMCFEEIREDIREYETESDLEALTRYWNSRS